MIQKMKSFAPLWVKRPVRKTIDYFNYKIEYNSSIRKKLSNVEHKRLIILGTPNSGNLGDHAIAEAEKKIIDENFPTVEYIEISFFQYLYNKKSIRNKIVSSDTILIHGGGFLGNLWIEAEYLVRDIITVFPKNKIIILPQTIFFSETYDVTYEMNETKKIYESHDKLTIFVREKQSFEFASNFFESKISIRLVPDIVTYLDESASNISRRQILTVLRNDHEKIDNASIIDQALGYLNRKEMVIKSNDNVLPFMVNEKNRKYHLEKQFDNFRESKLVITDRLHGMIFALITGTPCIAMNNSSGKVKGVYEWIKDYEYIKCIDTDIEEVDLLNIIDKLLRIPNDNLVYNPARMREKFGSLILEMEDSLKSDN